ncbi:MAG TPA: X2-like carbohydrate binding domain-containing protein, partial [Clostridia bacterium]
MEYNSSEHSSLYSESASSITTTSSGVTSYIYGILTGTTDNINSNFTSNSLSGYNFNDMVPLASGWVIIGDTSKNKVIIVNAITSEVAKEYQLNSSPEKIDFNPNKGQIIASQNSSNHVALIDAFNDQIKYITIPGPAVDIAFTKDNFIAAIIPTGTAWWEKKVSILNLENGNEIAYIDNQDPVDYACITYNTAANSIFVGESPSTSSRSLTRLVFNEDTKLLEKKEFVRDPVVSGNSFAVSPDGLHVAFAYGISGDTYTFNDIDATNINHKIGEWNTGAYPAAAQFSKDGKYLITSNYFSIQLFDVEAHTLIKTIADSDKYSMVGMSNSGRIAFSKTEDGKLCSYLISISNVITCSSPVYDPSNPKDMTVNVLGYALNVIKNGTSALKSSDYSISGNIVTIKKSYLTYYFNKFSTPDQKLNLTFHFKLGDDQDLTVSQVGVSNNINCDNPFYDPTNPRDITVNITGAAVSTIKNGTTTLTSSDCSVSGSTVTIKKSYLSYFFNKFNSPDQKLYLSFDFISGNNPILIINKTMISNAVTCKNPAFDPLNPQDITVNITGAPLVAVKNGTSALTSSDYSLSGNVVSIKKSYLTYFFNKFNLPDQKLSLTFDFSSGNDPALSIRHSIIPYDDSVLTKTIDNINANFASNNLSGYSFDDMIPLSDGWVIIGDTAKNEVFIVNAISGEVAKEYKLNSTPKNIDFNPEKGLIIASQTSSNNIAVIDAINDEIKYIPTSGPAVDIAFAKGNYAAAIISTGTLWMDKKISILNWTNGSEIASYSDQNYYYI